jgi:predicted MFS family arabinose efflux permease
LVTVLQRHFPNRWIWFASQIVMALGLALPVVQPGIVSIIVAGICVGGTFMIITMMGMMEMHRLVPPHDVIRHIAIMTAAFASGQIIGPLFSGLLRDLSGSFSPSLVIASAALAVTALALIIQAPKQAEYQG